TFAPWESWMFRHVPGYRWLFRQLLFWRQEMLGLGFSLHPQWMRLIERMARHHMERSIPDPELRRKVTPSYMPGCKRLLISNDYLPSLTRSNVEVITEELTEIREHGVVTADGRERPVDVLIYGTGFHVTEPLSPLRIIGRDGVDINAAWQN